MPLWIHDFLFIISCISPHFPRRAPSSWPFGVSECWLAVSGPVFGSSGWSPEVGLQAEGPARVMLCFRLCLGQAFPGDFSVSVWQLFAICFGAVLINERGSFVFSTPMIASPFTWCSSGCSYSL